MSKQVKYTQSEQDLARSLTTTIEAQEDTIRVKKQAGAMEVELKNDKRALLSNVTKLNALLDRKPMDYTPVTVNSL